MIEYLEVYDADGNPTGVAHPRSKVHREGLFHKTVFIWVLDSNLNVLIQQRASCKESSPNLFDVSSAGHITWGDTTEQTVLKELNEELGLVATFDENEAKQKKIPMMKLMKAKNFISHVFPERNYTDNEFFDIFVVIIPQIFIPQQNDAKSSTDSTESSPQMQENLQDFSIQTVKMQESEVQSCFKVNFFLLKELLAEFPDLFLQNMISIVNELGDYIDFSKKPGNLECADDGIKTREQFLHYLKSRTQK